MTKWLKLLSRLLQFYCSKGRRRKTSKGFRRRVLCSAENPSRFPHQIRRPAPARRADSQSPLNASVWKFFCYETDGWGSISSLLSRTRSESSRSCRGTGTAKSERGCAVLAEYEGIDRAVTGPTSADRKDADHTHCYAAYALSPHAANNQGRKIFSMDPAIWLEGRRCVFAAPRFCPAHAISERHGCSRSWYCASLMIPFSLQAFSLHDALESRQEERQWPTRNHSETPVAEGRGRFCQRAVGGGGGGGGGGVGGGGSPGGGVGGVGGGGGGFSGGGRGGGGFFFVGAWGGGGGGGVGGGPGGGWPDSGESTRRESEQRFAPTTEAPGCVGCRAGDSSAPSFNQLG